VIIKAIGFNVDYIPRFEVTGKDGVTMRELWSDHPWVGLLLDLSRLGF
jgi:hypothetical protein